MIYEIDAIRSSFSAYFSRGLSHINMSVDSGRAKLESIIVDDENQHLGTVLLLCGTLWADDLELTQLIGSFTPIKGKEKIARIFYNNRSIEVSRDNSLSGQISRIRRSCEESCNRHDVRYLLTR